MLLRQLYIIWLNENVPYRQETWMACRRLQVWRTLIITTPLHGASISTFQILQVVTGASEEIMHVIQNNTHQIHFHLQSFKCTHPNIVYCLQHNGIDKHVWQQWLDCVFIIFGLHCESSEWQLCIYKTLTSWHLKGKMSVSVRQARYCQDNGTSNFGKGCLYIRTNNHSTKLMWFNLWGMVR